MKSIIRSTGHDILVDLNDSLTYDQLKDYKERAIWQDLLSVTVGEAIEIWIATLSSSTAKNYRSGMNFLIAHGLLKPHMNLQMFSLVNYNSLIDGIKLLQGKSEGTKQARAACFISFTRFLSRRTDGLIRHAVACREGTTKTFFKVREKVKTHAMTQKQWLLFLKELEKINKRDCLVAKLVLQGGKRISEVLSIKAAQINVNSREIIYYQSKTRGYHKETVITYSQAIIDELQLYMGHRKGYVFITRNKKPVFATQLNYTFALAGRRAGIPFKVTPHVLRASAVTYLKQAGFSDSDIMKVTGHASSSMVHAYDKSERADNPTRVVSLV